MVLNTVVDDFGNRSTVGQQKDVIEYLLNFLERIEEGLGEEPPELTANKALSATRDTLDTLVSDKEDSRSMLMAKEFDDELDSKID